MKVAVIIVEFNNAEETVNYVKKINKYENINRIVIVDNASTVEDTMPKLKEIESEKVVVLQSEKNGGYAYGNNFGISYLQEKGDEYDYIIISNPDIDIEKTAIDKCLDVLENDEKVAVIAPRMYNAQNKPIRRSSWKIRTPKLDMIHSTRLLEILFYKKLRSGEYLEDEYENELLEVEAISGAFFIIKNTVLNEIGLFDDNVFLFYEEDILAQRLRVRGYKTYSLNSEKFIHFESQTIGKTLSYYNKMKQLYISKMYYQKEYNKINGFQIFIFQILNVFRKIELIFEIPIRKFMKK